MKNYVEELGLRFDPFEPSASRKDFYGGGWRQELCNQIIESAMYGENIIAVYGALGSGKSVLAHEIARSFDDEAVTALIHATLFMNSEQFVEAIADQLNLSEADVSKEKVIEAVADLAHQLDLEAKSLLLQVDDAHELSREVLQDLLQIKAACPPSSIHVILFGESQLANMLQSILTVEQGSALVEMDIPSFASEATIDYVRFKLERAGFSKPLPISGASLGSIHNASHGIPGAINSLAGEILEREYGHTHVDAAVGSIDNLERDYQTGDIDESAEDFDDDPGPPNRRSAAEQDSDADRSPALIYMIAASVLVIAFLGALVFMRPEAPAESIALSIPIAAQAESPVVASSAAEPARIIAPTATPALVSPDSPAPVQATGQVVRAIDSLAATSANIASTDLSVIAPALQENEQAPTASKPVAAKPAPVVKPVAPTTVKTDPVKATASKLTSFEQKLMARPGTNYAVQILGASSEASVSKFIAKEKLSLETGFFETRLNGKPWYVVLVGNFPSRSAATAAMEALPAAAKAYGPWVRPVSDVQTAIRALQPNR